jgi:hypothetical protein
MLAHQGGWDETLLIIVPMFVVVMLLRLAKRRVEREAPIDAPSTPSSSSSPSPSPAPAPDDRDDGITP